MEHTQLYQLICKGTRESILRAFHLLAHFYFTWYPIHFTDYHLFQEIFRVFHLIHHFTFISPGTPFTFISPATPLIFFQEMEETQLYQLICKGTRESIHSSSKETQLFWTHFSRWPWVTDAEPGSCTFCKVCQVWLWWHNLLGFGGTNSHQRTPSHEFTHLHSLHLLQEMEDTQLYQLICKGTRESILRAFHLVPKLDSFHLVLH